ncbi:hypothetical protein [Tepidimonas charontis]|uniref:HicB family protein n=1 Tax=Tepidimonas charontis TaxID=2267262 RepID=A0A554XB48_9BURK|nr:hypothetical protein [Tepidimonas charontis]TSE33054.1 hypothetical protein Tchar_01935 [Tepidimonas charontis]
MAQFALRLPDSLMAYAKKLAEEEHVSMNQLFLTAIAEKIASLKTEAYFRERQQQGREAAFDAWLAAVPNDEPMPGDELDASHN